MNNIRNELKNGFKNILTFYENKDNLVQCRSDLYFKRIRKHEYMFIIKTSEGKIPMSQLITIKRENVQLVARGRFLDGIDSNRSKIHIEFDTETKSIDFLSLIVTAVANNWR